MFNVFIVSLCAINLSNLHLLLVVPVRRFGPRLFILFSFCPAYTFSLRGGYTFIVTSICLKFLRNSVVLSLFCELQLTIFIVVENLIFRKDEKDYMNFYKKSALALIIFGVLGMSLYCSLHQNNYSNFRKAEQIYQELNNYRISYDLDKRAVGLLADIKEQPIVGVDKAINNIAHFVARAQPVQFVLVGFPFKSGNSEKKVIGFLPDMAERKSLEYLQQITDAVKAVYAPGANVLIYCDGVPFADTLGIPVANVMAYEQALKTMVKDLPNITIFSSEDMVKKHGLSSIDEIIPFFDGYNPSDEQMRSELKQLPAVLLKRIEGELDYARGQEHVRKIGLHEIVTQIISREERLRTYIGETFQLPHYIRLTVHLATDVSKKFGLRLSPDSDVTPYHGVMVEDGEQWMIKFKKDIDLKNYVLDAKDVNGIRYAYYRKR